MVGSVQYLPWGVFNHWKIREKEDERRENHYKSYDNLGRYQHLKDPLFVSVNNEEYLRKPYVLFQLIPDAEGILQPTGKPLLQRVIQFPCSVKVEQIQLEY